MTNYILRRLLQTVFTFLLLSFVCFYILTLMPGDPVDILASSNPDITTEDIERLKKLYGLDQPAYYRYWNWLKDVTSGELGYSRTYKIPVSEIIPSRLMNTFILAGISLFLAILIAIPLGVLSALKNGTKLDYIINFLAFVGISWPSFFLAIVLIIVFGVWLQWLPAGGTYTSGLSLHGFDYFLDRMKYLILPVLSLTALQMGAFVRYTRSAVLETLKDEYVKTAKAKGLNSFQVTVYHIFRNALLPIVTIIGISFSFVFSGSIITETVFSYQGVGKLVYDAIIANDFNLAMIGFMLPVGMVLIMSLVVDIIYVFLDPRISYV